MKASVYIAYHKPFPIVESEIFKPIHVGAALKSDDAKLPMLHDDQGSDHISEKNSSYCELTALYWIWKNDTESDYVGLMHYRRLFDFTQTIKGEQAEIYVNKLSINDYIETNEQAIAKLIESDIDGVFPKNHVMGRTLYGNFTAGHGSEMLDISRDIIELEHPELLAAYDKYINGHNVLLANMCFIKKDIFDAYCEWVFPILDKVASKINTELMNPYQSRALGFVSERLMSVYFLHHFESASYDKFRRTHILNLSKSLVFPYKITNQEEKRDIVNLVCSADTNYLPHTAAMVNSVIQHADATRDYRFYFLHDNVHIEGLLKLDDLVESYSNVEIMPINISNFFADSFRSSTRSPSNSTYNRFLIFKLFPFLEKVLYIDVDMIALGDVAEIYDIDLGDNKVGAVPDFIMTRVLNKKVMPRDESFADIKTYFNENLGLTDTQILSYFNAGLILFNLQKIDCDLVGDELIHLSMNGKYLFRDQDILNHYFKDDYLRLPAQYNVFNSRLVEYESVPKINYDEALMAKKKPFIIHYAAGHNKPWTNADAALSQHYWKSLIETPFYLKVMDAFTATKIANQLAKLPKPAEKKTVAKPQVAVVPQQTENKMYSQAKRFGKAIATRAPGLRPLLNRIDKSLKK